MTRLYREFRLKPLEFSSPQKENIQRIASRYPESADYNSNNGKYQANLSLPALPPFKKLIKIEQTV